MKCRMMRMVGRVLMGQLCNHSYSIYRSGLRSKSRSKTVCVCVRTSCRYGLTPGRSRVACVGLGDGDRADNMTQVDQSIHHESAHVSRCDSPRDLQVAFRHSISPSSSSLRSGTGGRTGERVHRASHSAERSGRACLAGQT